MAISISTMIELLLGGVLVFVVLCWLAWPLGLVESAIRRYKVWKLKRAIRKMLMEGEKR